MLKRWNVRDGLRCALSSFTAVRLTLPALGLLLCACSEQTQDAAAEPPEPAAAEAAPGSESAPAEAIPSATRGLYFGPDLTGFAAHDEYDADGDGDGVNETHVKRYVNEAGDTAFSMTTGERVWAWSLDTKADDGSNVRENYVVRDSNCDKVFDERYSLNAEFHVPACLAKTEGDTP